MFCKGDETTTEDGEVSVGLQGLICLHIIRLRMFLGAHEKPHISPLAIK